MSSLFGQIFVIVVAYAVDMQVFSVKRRMEEMGYSITGIVESTAGTCITVQLTSWDHDTIEEELKTLRAIVVNRRGAGVTVTTWSSAGEVTLTVKRTIEYRKY